MGAQATSADPNNYDIHVATSDDGVTPRGGPQSVWNNIAAGPIGTSITTRKVSAGNDGQYDYQEQDAPYVLVGVFANQPARFVAEVHCTRDYPQ